MRKETAAWLLTITLLGGGCGTSPSDVSTSPGALPSPSPSASVSSSGRAILLAQDGPAVVAAIDALGPTSAAQVYQQIGTFNDADPQASGTVTAACQALATIVNNPSLGAAAVYTLLTHCAPSNGQGLLIAFAANLDPSVDSGLSRCQDSLTATAAPQNPGNRNPEVMARLAPPVQGMPLFHALRELSPGTLLPSQRSTLKQIRDTLTYPAAGARLQKVLKVTDMQKYLNGTFDKKVFGFQAVYSDVDDLTTSAQLIEGARLDYPGGFQGQTLVGALTFFQDSTFTLTPPYSSANGGSVNNPYPYTGNGFTATVRGDAIPEWVAPPTGVTLQEQSQLYLVDAYGNRVLQATLTGGRWVTPAGAVLAREVPARQPVERPARYRGQNIYVISRDDLEYYVHSPTDIPLPQESQVGPQDYRGSIPVGDPELHF